MRLWHKDLIKALPRQQLLSQWRECCCIAKNLAKNGTPNHILVNEITKYTPFHFETYTNMVLNEMEKRNYKISEKALSNFRKNFNMYDATIDYAKIPKSHWLNGNVSNIFCFWHNSRYFFQCYYNLQEKYDRGMFSNDEWLKICKVAKKYANIDYGDWSF